MLSTLITTIGSPIFSTTALDRLVILFSIGLWVILHTLRKKNVTRAYPNENCCQWFCFGFMLVTCQHMHLINFG